MAPNTQILASFTLFIIGSIIIVQGVPLDSPASAAVPVVATPAVSLAPVISPAATPDQTPVVVGANQPDNPNPSQDPAGSGSITEHTQPDGSVIKITRFNGQLPSSAFSGYPFGFYPSPQLPQYLYDAQIQNMALLYRNNLNTFNYLSSAAASNRANALAYYNPFVPQVVSPVPAWYSPSYLQPGLSGYNPAPASPWGSPYGTSSYPYYFPWAQQPQTINSARPQYA